MALDTDQDAYFKERLGSGYDDFDAEERLIRLGGAGFESGVVVEVLNQRLADLSVRPASFTVVGEYSEDRSKNIALVQEQLVTAQNEAAAAGVGVADVAIQQAAIFDYTKTALDTEEFMARGGRLSGGR